jgi:hypothetical protein
MTVGTSIGHGKILERISIFWPKRFEVIVNQSNINCGLMRNVQKLLIEGSGLHHSGCRTQVTQMKITRVTDDRKLVDISGRRKGNI